jgi:hypothetical protein
VTVPVGRPLPPGTAEPTEIESVALVTAATPEATVGSSVVAAIAEAIVVGAWIMVSVTGLYVTA